MLLVVVGLSGAALAFTYTKFVGKNKNPIVIGAITGTYGHVGSASSSGSNVAAGRYGYMCNGSCCHPASQPTGTLTNILLVSVTWQPHNQGFSWTVEATSEIKNKSASTTAFDDNSGNCGPVPAFNTTSTVNMTEAAPGASGGTTYLPGVEASMYSVSHTSPGTQDVKNSGSGPTWQDSPPHPVYDSWEVDPDNPDSLTYTCSATVLNGFHGNASEVVGVVSQHGADCVLSVAVM